MTTQLEEAVSTLNIKKDIQIAAAVEDSWDSLLELLGPANEFEDGKPFPMKIEPWPGGRWFRDLGNNTGHLWAHVQVIKPPALLELYGPLFMSYPAISHVQYRLKAENGGTLLTMCHRAMGLIPDEHRQGVNQGWEYELKKIKERAERRAKANASR
jgi:hypothetical protein